MSRYAWVPLVGVAVLAMSVWMAALSPKTIAHPSGDLPKSPMTAFELVRTPAQLSAVIGEDSATPAFREIRSRFDRENRWDFLFMALYGGFLGAFFRAARERRAWLFVRAFWLLPAICIAADALEDLVLFRLTGDGGDVGRSLLALQVFTWMKWGGLGLTTTLVAVVIAADRSTRVLRLLAAIGAAATAAATVAAFVSPAKFASVMVLAMVAAWLVMMGYGAVKALASAAAPATDGIA